MAHIGQCEDCGSIDIVGHINPIDADLCPKCLAGITETREMVVRMALGAILAQQIWEEMIRV